MDRTLIEHHRADNCDSSGAATVNTAGGNNKATSPVFYYTKSAVSEEEESAVADACSDSESPSFRSSSVKQQEGVSSASSVNTNNAQPSNVNSNNGNNSTSQQNTQDMNPTLRPLGDFLFEDPTVYTSEEIREVLDMINDGNLRDDNRNNRSNFDDGVHPFMEKHGGTTNIMNNNNGMPSMQSSSTVNNRYSNSQKKQSTNISSNIGNNGGLEPICKAYGILGFIRFLDCYYLTLITKRAKVGCIGGNSIYTVKVCF